MHVLLHLTLEDSRSGGLVKAGSFEDVGGINPVVLATAHDMFFQVGAELILPDGYLQEEGQASATMNKHLTKETLTPL